MHQRSPLLDEAPEIDGDDLSDGLTWKRTFIQSSEFELQDTR